MAKQTVQLPPAPTPAPPRVPQPMSHSFSGIPMSDAPIVGYVTRHIDITLTADQADGLWRLMHGLDEARAMLKNGRRVVTPPDAMRWLLERLSDER